MWIQLLALELIDGASGASLSGRSRRRRRIWQSALAEAPAPTQALVAKERRMVEQMLLQAELDQLLDERKVLLAAVDQAARRQQKALTTMVERIDKRVDDIVEDEDLTMLLL
jgi:hypothetical protein